MTSSLRKITLTGNFLRNRCRIVASKRISINTDNSKPSWMFEKSDGRSKGHSSLLSGSPEVYEFISVTANPVDWEKYLQHSEKVFTILGASKDVKFEHLASWTYISGDINFKALHLLKYPEGWNEIDSAREALKKNEEYQEEIKKGLPYVRRQSNQILMGFSFWPAPNKRTGNNLYDVRTYTLKPGSMFDWANYWARGIKCRTKVRADIPYCGLFTQIGNLHTIYHVWCYTGLADRKACRSNTWDQPQWNDVVASTIPLINTMTTKILEPLTFSPTQ